MTTLDLSQNGPIATVTLRRPKVHNALNPAQIAELTEVFTRLSSDAGTRVVVLAAEGKSFCAGADIGWMREAANAEFAENEAGALKLAQMYRAIYECPKPVVARVQGPAYGGGVGLVAVCDIVLAVPAASFCFSEVKLGLAPAVIAPFVLRKLPAAIARRYFITAEQMTAYEACRVGLVTAIANDVDQAVERWTSQLLANGPEAMAACKRLVDELEDPDWNAVLPRVARRIAELRASDEGREGLAAFLEKRPAAWRKG